MFVSVLSWGKLWEDWEKICNTKSDPKGLIDVQDNNDDEQEEDEEDLELDQPLGSPRRSSIRVSQSELLESLKPGKILYLLKKIMTDCFWYGEGGKKYLKIIFLAN